MCYIYVTKRAVQLSDQVVPVVMGHFEGKLNLVRLKSFSPIA